jgi:hypothetical protein
VYEDQSWPSILLEIGFLTCSLSKKEISLERGALCTRERQFSKERKRRIASGFGGRVCKETEEASTLRLAHIFNIAEVFSYRSDQEDLQKGAIHLLRRFCIWLR